MGHMAGKATHWLVGILGAMVTAGAAAAASVLVTRRLATEPSGTAPSSPPQLIPVKLTASSKDVDLGGGWTLHDVADYQSSIGRAKLAAGYAPGAIVTLVLSNRGGPPVAYLARVLNTLPGGYAGTWEGLKPLGGPQMVDFSAENILA